LNEVNLETAEGKDLALRQLRRPLAALPASALREELVRLVAGRLGLNEELVAQLAAAPAPQGAPRTESGARAALDRRERSERTFLALCIALPEPGRDALRRLDPERHFTGELTRRAAVHLRDHVAAPLQGLGEDDDELSGLLAELALRASRETTDPAALEVELLQLEKLRLEREIAAAEAAGSGEVSELAARRSRVRAELETAMDRATAVRPGC
jgi:DNA primase